MNRNSLTHNQVLLHKAVSSNDLQTARDLLESGVSPDFYTNNYDESLFICAMGSYKRHASRSMLKLLLQYKERISNPSLIGKAIIHATYNLGDAECLKLFVEAGVPVRSMLYGHDGLISMACRCCHFELLKYLLELAPPCPDRLAHCLMEAVEAPWKCEAPVDRVFPVAKLLVDHGANVRFTAQKWSVLDEAMSNDDVATARLLLEHGAGDSVAEEFNYVIAKHGVTLLPFFEKTGCSLNKEMLEDIENGRHLIALIREKDLPALDAFLKEKLEPHEQRSLEPDFTDDRGESALCIAYRSGFMQGYDLLLEHGASADIAEVYTGITPLMLLAENPRSTADDVVKLLRHRADRYSRNYSGESVLRVYCRQHRADLALALISYCDRSSRLFWEFDLLHEDRGYSLTALQLARKYNLPELVDPLLSMGAIDE